ncbi:sigma-70 family RNA polymerase sigma factor [Thalassospira sp.]|uniref:RNA polymerase sigma factor n=1 Tax=Thalassospira sp. TaxID=1912094 RepID=UPI00311E63D7
MLTQAELLTIDDENKEDLTRFSRSIVGDMPIAEDVLQEAWMKFLRAAGTRQFDEPVAYLRTIVRTLSLDALRRIKRENARISGPLSDGLEAADHNSPGPEQTAIARLELERLQGIMAELPEKTQQALLAYWQEEKSLRDIAQMLGVSLGQAHGLIKNGVEHCRLRMRGREKQN